MAQARHARAVHSFICELLAIVMPDLVRGSEYIKNSTEYQRRGRACIHRDQAPLRPRLLRLSLTMILI